MDLLQDEKLRLMFNVFPAGKSFLQMLANPQGNIVGNTNVFKDNYASECKLMFEAA